jgi:hypothetical protein
MIAAALLLAAAAAPSGATATAYATARVVRGERISLASPASAPDRLLRVTQTTHRQDGLVRLRVVEFQ